MKFVSAVALLLASSNAIRLHNTPNTAIDSEGRAKSESMPQHGGTATDNSNGGKMAHGEAKVNQKDVAGYKKLSDTVLKNSLTREGPIHEHLGSDKASTASERPAISFQDAFKDVKKHDNTSLPAPIPENKPAPTPKADPVNDAKIVAEEAEKNEVKTKENLKVVKAENAAKESEEKVAALEKKASEDEKEIAKDDKKVDQVAKDVVKDDKKVEDVAKDVVKDDKKVEDVAKDVVKDDKKVEDVAKDVVKDDKKVEDVAKDVVKDDKKVEKVAKKDDAPAKVTITKKDDAPVKEVEKKDDAPVKDTITKKDDAPVKEVEKKDDAPVKEVTKDEKPVKEVTKDEVVKK